jgi:Transposase
MKRVRFSEEQIIAVLREDEAGAKTADLARKYGISLFDRLEVNADDFAQLRRTDHQGTVGQFRGAFRLGNRRDGELT